MKFIVSLDYKRFGFETIEDAGNFACMAKNRTLNPSLDVKIEVFEDPDEDSDEDSETEE